MKKVIIYHHRLEKSKKAKGKQAQDLEIPYTEENFNRVRQFHRRLDGYRESPMVSLDALARDLGLGGLYVKDESTRFGLNAFKGLGASFAVDYVLRQDPSVETLVTATDGNHGKAVAWAARQRGKKAVVFMPKGTVSARSKAIEELGARVFVTDVNYAGAVAMATKYAEKYKAALVQDTAFPGYHDIPEKIVLGYSTMAAEAADALDERGVRPTHIFLQAGVGSMAAGNIAYFAHRYKNCLPTFIIVEAKETACIWESIKNGRWIVIDGHSDTRMAGLNCGEANPDILSLMNEFAEFYVKCDDQVTFDGMKRLAHPLGSDERIVSGECGGVGTGLVMMLMTDPELSHERKEIGLNEESVVLLFNTEGDTDPEFYKEIIRV